MFTIMISSLLVMQVSVNLGKSDSFFIVATRPHPNDVNMARDHGAIEAGKLSEVWTRGRREIA